MLLPKQAEPVQRSHTSCGEAREKSQEIQPQGDCVCRPDGAGGGTWWCIVGRTLWNTKQPCVP
jgi:hypothetical protein